MPNPIFISTSNEKPQLLTISFEDDPQGSLGAQLINCDKVSMICVEEEVEENVYKRRRKILSHTIEFFLTILSSFLCVSFFSSLKTNQKKITGRTI
jgi:hypothetical protein